MEPVVAPGDRPPRILVAGIGNVFLADDAFGPEVVAALHDHPLPDGVHVADFGIRGMDLAYRLLDGYDVAVLVDAAPRGAAPGTLCLIEPDPADTTGPAAPEAHGMDPVKVLALARSLTEDGSLTEDERAALPRILVLGCEPLVRMRGDEPDVDVGLSAPVRAAVDEAVRRLHTLTARLLHDPATPLEPDPGPLQPARR
ncbi:hydrogenase maturation protease [Streptomyces sp. SCA3-4]|nr:hydrogenase maturation protease [Streptomyces sichuanensis]